jgi:mannosidase alpha-like ER degradation enhancer 2
MESFFLAETLKYLYLIFDTENFLHNDISSNNYKVIQNENGKFPLNSSSFICLIV